MVLTSHFPSVKKFLSIGLKKTIEKTTQTIYKKLVDEVNEVLELNLCSDVQNLQKDSKSLNQIMTDLKNKFHQEKKKTEKIRLLTLIPSNWSYKKTKENFNCSQYMFRKAMSIKQTGGESFTSDFLLSLHVNNILYMKFFMGIVR